jgi:hypothetical protein
MTNAAAAAATICILRMGSLPSLREQQNERQRLHVGQPLHHCSTRDRAFSPFRVNKAAKNLDFRPFSCGTDLDLAVPFDPAKIDVLKGK